MSGSILYFVKITWFNDIVRENENEHATSAFYAFAPSLNNLTTRIESQFDNIEKLEIRIINDYCSNEEFFWCDEVSNKARKDFENSNVY